MVVLTRSAARAAAKAARDTARSSSSDSHAKSPNSASELAPRSFQSESLFTSSTLDQSEIRQISSQEATVDYTTPQSFPATGEADGSSNPVSDILNASTVDASGNASETLVAAFSSHAESFVPSGVTECLATSIDTVAPSPTIIHRRSIPAERRNGSNQVDCDGASKGNDSLSTRENDCNVVESRSQCISTSCLISKNLTIGAFDFLILPFPVPAR